MRTFLRPFMVNAKGAVIKVTELLKISGLVYEYDGIPALCGVDFSLAADDTVALVGANGAGKSTLLQLMTGVLVPAGGVISFCGDPVTKKTLPLLRQKIGLVFQNAEHQLFCNSVLDDVMFGPLNMGLSREEAAKAAELALRRLGAERLKDRAPYRLSAGEKRLAAIACVLSMQPEILLMDEPTAELDPRARRELAALLRTLPQAKIIATHDLDFAQKTCSSVMILHQGKIAARGGVSLLSDEALLESLGL